MRAVPSPTINLSFDNRLYTSEAPVLAMRLLECRQARPQPAWISQRCRANRPLPHELRVRRMDLRCARRPPAQRRRLRRRRPQSLAASERARTRRNAGAHAPLLHGPFRKTRSCGHRAPVRRQRRECRWQVKRRSRRSSELGAVKGGGGAARSALGGRRGLPVGQPGLRQHAPRTHWVLRLLTGGFTPGAHPSW